MEEGFIKEKEEIRRKFEVKFRRILQQQSLKFESEIQGYEHDISVLKYQKEQLEKCFSLEMRPNYPSPKSTLTLTSHLAKCWIRGGVGGQFARNLN